MTAAAMIWRWVRLDVYEARRDGHLYTVERKEDDPRYWLCRRDGIAFDQTRSLRQAKQWCEQGEA
jgi:hypothetical protein